MTTSVATVNSGSPDTWMVMWNEDHPSLQKSQATQLDSIRRFHNRQSGLTTAAAEEAATETDPNPEGSEASTSGKIGLGAGKEAQDKRRGNLKKLGLVKQHGNSEEVSSSLPSMTTVSY